MAVTRLFAYGLLLKGMRYHDSHLAGQYGWVTGGSAEGRLMYLPEPDCPVMCAGEGNVQGELYDIEDKLLTVLDGLFGYRDGQPERSDYVRRRIVVTTAAGEAVEAWVYVVRCEVVRTRFPDARFIEEGDWRAVADEIDQKRRDTQRKRNADGKSPNWIEDEE